MYEEYENIPWFMGSAGHTQSFDINKDVEFSPKPTEYERNVPSTVWMTANNG